MAKGKSGVMMTKKSGNILNPCGVCSSDCYIDVILCDACDTWFHTSCQNLSSELLGILKTLPKGFLCVTCRATPEGNFDFSASLSRLYIASGLSWEDLENAAVLEEVLLSCHDAPLADRPAEPITIDIPELSVDQTSMELLEKFGGLRGFHPVLIEVDGDALFRSVSIAMYGTDSLTQELRLRCCLEMIRNQVFYEETHRSNELASISPEYRQSCIDCATSQGASSAWTLHAIASVVQVPVLSVYPTVNGLMDRCVSILNNKFLPREGATSNDGISILWTRFGDVQCLEGCWVPNHFVPLIAASANAEEPNSDIAVTEAVTIASQDGDTFGTTKLEVMENEGIPLSEGHLISVVEVDPAMDDEIPTLPVRAIKKESPATPAVPSETEAPVEYEDPPLSLSPPPVIATPIPKPAVKAPHRTHVLKPAPFSTPLEAGFLTTDQLLKVINTEDPGLDYIPKGLKEDVYFVINNARNLERRSLGQRSIFSDDCGAYSTKSSSTKTTIFQYDGARMTYLIRQNGKYGKWIKKAFTELSPQPDETKLIVMKRYYGTLKRQPGYRKRVSWFENLPDSEYLAQSMFKAVVEYTGEFPDDISIHGNAKSRCTEYTQMPVVEMHSTAEEIIGQLKPKAAFAKLAAEGSAPRNIRQIQNKRYNMKKKARLALESDASLEGIKAEPMEDIVTDGSLTPGVTNIVIDASQEIELANNGQLVLETVRSNGEPATYYIIQTEAPVDG